MPRPMSEEDFQIIIKQRDEGRIRFALTHELLDEVIRLREIEKGLIGCLKEYGCAEIEIAHPIATLAVMLDALNKISAGIKEIHAMVCTRTAAEAAKET